MVFPGYTFLLRPFCDKMCSKANALMPLSVCLHLRRLPLQHVLEHEGMAKIILFINSTLKFSPISVK